MNAPKRKPASADDKTGPVRQCMGCRNKFPKFDLFRVVRTPDNDVILDLSGKANGRGVYVCRESACFKRVKKIRALERSLKSPVSDDIFITIEKMIDASTF
jgi:hypothetical protein